MDNTKFFDQPNKMYKNSQFNDMLTSFTGVLNQFSDEVVADGDAEVAQHELQLGWSHVAVAVAV